MHLTSYLSVAVTVLGLAAASPKGSTVKRSPEPKLENGHYIVDRATKFANKQVWTFQGTSLPDGLYASDYQVGDTHVFTPSNVKVKNGYLVLTVPGGQKQMPYKSAEVATDFENIKYASVRTTAILSEPAGVCNGMFFYKDDTQESDIEWLSDPNSESNFNGVRRLWFTNQDTTGGDNPSDTNVLPPSNPTTTEHEYRIDWTQGKTVFYVDGVRKWTTTKNVPTVPGSWIWNNWSNGDKGWSVGPPQKTAVFKISKIEMYYNTV